MCDRKGEGVGRGVCVVRVCVVCMVVVSVCGEGVGDVCGEGVCVVRVCDVHGGGECVW